MQDQNLVLFIIHSQEEVGKEIKSVLDSIFDKIYLEAEIGNGEKLFDHGNPSLIIVGGKEFEDPNFHKNHPKFLSLLIKFPLMLMIGTEEDRLIEKSANQDMINDFFFWPASPENLLRRVRLNLAMEKMNSLGEIYRSNYDLLQMICHDLANPVNSLLLCLEILGPKGDKFPEIWPQLEACTKSSKRILDFVRDHTWPSLGQSHSKKENCINELIHTSLLILKAKIKNKNIQVVNQIQDNLKIYVEEVSFVNSVLNNILNNAISYSPKESEIHLTVNDHPDYKAVIKVRDSGQGVPRELREIINSGEDVPAKTLEYGIGLYMVQSFLNQMGGRLELRDLSLENQQGTEALLFIP